MLDQDEAASDHRDGFLVGPDFVSAADRGRLAVSTSPTSRHAYSLHCISGTADYPEWNWLQRPADMPLRRLGSVG